MFDPHHDVVRCPARKPLTPRDNSATGKRYRVNRRDCARCPLKGQCLPRGTPSRRVHIAKSHAAILRARRKRAACGDEERAICTRHRWQAEGARVTVKTLDGLARAIRTGLENMKSQALLTVIATNPKNLAAALMLPACSIIENRPARPVRASV